MPRSPETHAKLSAVLDAWNALPHERMVADALAGLSWRDYPCASYRAPKEWRTPLPQTAESAGPADPHPSGDDGVG